MKRKSIIISLVLAMITSVCLGGATLFGAAATQEEVFATNGAGIMITSQSDANKNGIRFNVVMDKDGYDAKANSGKEFRTGVLVLPADLVDGEFTLANYGEGQNGCVNKDTTALWEYEGKLSANANGIYEPTAEEGATEFMSCYVYLYDIPAESLNRNITFIGYYIYDNGAPVYTGALTRSMAYVADQVIKNYADDYDAEELALIGGYLLNYQVKFGDVETKTVKYGETVTGALPVAEQTGKEFAGWVKADGTPFNAAEPIRGNITLQPAWKTTVTLKTVAEYEKYSSFNGDTPVENATALAVDVTSVADGVSADGTLKFVKDGTSVDVPADKYSVNGNVISVNAAAYGAGEGKFVYSTADKLIEIPVLIVNKIITTASDLLNMKAYGEYAETGYTEGDRKYTLGGYFVLGNNIDLGTATVAPYTGLANGINDGTNYDATGYGFTGTFDGKGYVINGGKYGKGGLFGQVAKSAVIKNVGFTNAAVHATDIMGQVIAVSVCGTIENVLIDVVSLSKTTGWYYTQALSFYITGASLNNVVVYYPNDGGAGNSAALTNIVMSGWYYFGKAVFSNVIVISDDEGIGYNSYMKGTAANKPADPAKYAAGTPAKDITGWNGIYSEDSVWGVVGGMLRFKQAVNYYNLQVSFSAQGEVKATQAVAYNGRATAPSISIENAVIDGWYTDQELTREFDFNTAIIADTVLYAKVKTVVETEEYDYELYTSLSGDERVANTGMAIDLTDSVSADLSAQATVTYQAQGQSAVTLTSDKYSVSGKVITVDLSDQVAGSKGFITYNTEDVTVKIPVFVVSKIITTANDLLNWNKYGDYTATEYTEDQRKYILDGYFKLGNNIDLGTASVIPFPTAAYGTNNGFASKDYGFIGTFDGQGYVISGGTYGRGGLFGQVGNGVVKNVAFINAKINATDICANVVAGLFQGTLENVLVDVAQVSGGSWQYRAGIANNIAVATLRNVVSYYPNCAVGQSAALCGSLQSAGWYYVSALTFENVIIITDDADVLGAASYNANKTYYPQPEPEQYAAGTTCAEITWDSSFTAADSIWDLTGSKATFKNAD